jgi:ribosome biogenesis GTPase / thiamine phosphate phosphatase
MIDKTWLHDLGWPYQDDATSEPQDAFLIGRVLRQDRQYYTVETSSGSKRARLPGKTRNRTSRKAELPAVGDWLRIEVSADQNGIADILYQYPRKLALCRQATGEVKEKQVLAANINLVFVISGLDQNFNVNRIERFLMMAWSSGLPAVLLLNKADLFPDPGAQLKALEPVLSGTPVHIISALKGTATETIASYLGAGKSAALVGSSGVGKSTLVNYLMGKEHMETKAVRGFDDKGRHTTTHRELCRLPGNQGLLVDTPGMRQAQLWADLEALTDFYGDIVTLAAACKYTDCQHAQEPLCNVNAAVKAGGLSQFRLTQYQKLAAYIA